MLTKLSNGLTVAVQPDHRFPLVSLRLYVHAGSAYETDDQAGISHQLEHMVFKGTEKRPKGAVASDVEKAGGYLNAATSFDYTVYLTDMPAAEWKLGMDVLKDMAFHPSLDPDELESEKKVVLAEQKRGEDSPGNRMFKRLQAQALKGTPYERPIIGYPETIMSYSVEGMREYIDRLYQPQSMLLVVVGDVNAAEALDEAQRLFGGMANTRPVAPPVLISRDALPHGGPFVSVETTPWNKVHLAITFPAYDQNDTRASSLEVLAQLLGGDETSTLYRRYKYDKLLVDSISASNYSFERLGIFTINATLSPENLAAFWELFCADMAKLPDHVFTARELERAKLNLEDSLYRQKETLAGHASKLGYFLFFGGGPDAETNYLTQVRMTDQTVLTELMREMFTSDRATVTALLPEESAGTNALPDAAMLESVMRAAMPPVPFSPEDAAAQTAGSEEIIELGDGRTLILLPDATLPYAAVDMVFTGGDSLSTPDKQGLATLTASVLTKGTKGMNATAIEDFEADRASVISASAGRQSFTVSLRYPARFEADLFGLLGTVLTGATLPEQELLRAKKSQDAAIVRRDDQPLSLAFSRIYPLLFGDHPYGYSSLGQREQLAAYTRGDIAAFWKKQSAQPWVMAVCGSFDRDAVIAAAKKLPSPAASASVPPVPVWGDQKELTIPLPGREQAHLLLIFPGVDAASPDVAGMNLLQNILAGQSGLLFRDLRDEQGLGYTVTAFQWQAPLAGATMFYIGTYPDKVEQAHEGFRTVIADLHANPLPEAELERGKNQLQGDYVRGRQRLGSRSAEAATLAVTGRDIHAEKALVDKAMALTPADLQALARKYLVLEKAYVVKVLP
ncbi:insulinase family protein [Desulfovibrio sp. OttesenSCG-928-I05]|nr:insulinase family protein [Desulfovibrio sp. OttesenSCG-928-I05]